MTPASRSLGSRKEMRGISAEGCFVIKSPRSLASPGSVTFPDTQIDAVLYSKTFEHQTGNLSSFTVAESQKEPGQIK